MTKSFILGCLFSDFRMQFLSAVNAGLGSSSSKGLYINSCHAHCQSGSLATWLSDKSPVLGNTVKTTISSIFFLVFLFIIYWLAAFCANALCCLFSFLLDHADFPCVWNIFCRKLERQLETGFMIEAPLKRLIAPTLATLRALKLILIRKRSQEV